MNLPDMVSAMLQGGRLMFQTIPCASQLHCPMIEEAETHER